MNIATNNYNYMNQSSYTATTAERTAKLHGKIEPK